MLYKNTFSTKILLLVLCLSLFLAGCSSEQQQAPPPPTPVKVYEVKKTNLPVVNTYMGKALGFLSVEVRAQIPGILLKKFYKEGDFVKQGQLLFEIDPSQAQAAFNQAKAMLAQANSSYQNAKKEWERIRPLYAKNAVSQRDRDQAEAQFLNAKANLDAATAAANDAQIQLGYTQVTAPISGYTSLEAKNEGNLISLDAQSSLLTVINQTDPMYVAFSFNGSEISKYKRLAREGKAVVYAEGAKATINTADGSPYPYTGEVSYVDTQINALTNSLQARAEFPNPNGELIPNMYTTVSVSRAELQDVLLIPQKAILQTAQGSMVYRLTKENTVELIAVELGDNVSNYFIIEGGIEENDIIVTEGLVKIYPNAKVSPIPEENLIQPTSTDSTASANANEAKANENPEEVKEEAKDETAKENTTAPADGEK